MELVVTGDIFDEDGVLLDVELWRRPFLGWGHKHAMLAEVRCRPRHYALIDMGIQSGQGATSSATVEAGELFFLTIGAWGASG